MEQWIEIIKAIFLGVVEGITEWLPISSTGHLILVSEWIKFDFSETFVNTFNTVIQLGAILAVVVCFFYKLNPLTSKKTDHERRSTWLLWFKVIVAVIPAGVLGLLFDDVIEAKFFNPFVVAFTLVAYGIMMLLLEKGEQKPTVHDFDQLSFGRAFGIGCFQCLALIPGTSRSAATIIGGMYLGTSRYVAAEFSFFLAIPTMLGASALKLLKTGATFSQFEWLILGIGTLVSFIISILAIKFLLAYIKKHNFNVFAYYRIALGLLLLLYFFL